MMRRQTERRGILAAGNSIVDQVKQINCYPELDQLALISTESRSNGGGPCGWTASGQTDAPAGRLLSQAKSSGMITVADMVSGRHEHFRQIAAAAATQLDYLLLNEIEAGWRVDRALRSVDRTDMSAVSEAANEMHPSASDGMRSLQDCLKIAVP